MGFPQRNHNIDVDERICCLYIIFNLHRGYLRRVSFHKISTEWVAKYFFKTKYKNLKDKRAIEIYF